MALRSATALAPAHITGFFKIYANGSTGAGLNLEEGALTTVSLLEEQGTSTASVHFLTINGQDADAPVSRRVLESFDKWLKGKVVDVAHRMSFPIGYGLGMSGAGTFSLSLALNEVLQAGLSYDQCQQIATDAEIFCGTGLGTVMSQRFTGVMIGDPPYPSRTVSAIAADENEVVCAFFEPIATASIIRSPDWKTRINEVGEHCMAELGRNPTVESFIRLSRHFTEATGLAGEGVREAMRQVPEASMAMLGQTVWALTRRPAEVANIFKALTPRVQISTLATSGAHILP